MTDNDTPRDAERLRLWAQGLRPLEAAAWLLTHALGGRLLTSPWVRETPAGLLRIDPDAAASESGHLSGGERRVLAIVTSLVSDSHPVDLGDAITGIDPATVRHVLRALGHAAGIGLAYGAIAPAATAHDDETAQVEAYVGSLDDVLDEIAEDVTWLATMTDMTTDELTQMIRLRVSATATQDDEVTESTESAPAASTDGDEAELEALEDELNPAFESLVGTLLMYKKATGMSTNQLTDMIYDRLRSEEGV